MIRYKSNGGGKIYEGKSLNPAIETALRDNVDTTLLADPEAKKEIVRDIKWCFLIYGTTPNDYFLFGFDKKNRSFSSRSSFVTDTCKDYTLSRYDGFEKYRELSDKFAVFNRVPNFFGRNVFLLNAEIKYDDFVNFVKKSSNLFIKPLSSSYGKGAMVFEVGSDNEIEALFKKLTAKPEESWMIEERIIQDRGMAVWNTTSVNTIRFTSILNKGEYHILTPVLRTGRQGSIVDNGGSGGILSNIDVKTGIVYTDGLDEHGHTFISHPDSHIAYKGWQVPKWKELLETAKAVHEAMPDHKYVGWDFALSEKGWVLIEGNWGQFLNQYVDKIGRKEEFLKFIK